MFKALKIVFSAWCIVMLLAVFAYSQSQDFREYIIKKGDTLWGISLNEILDPFLWPKIWKENPEIRNPDLIYPGQKIRIPLQFIQKETPPPPKAIEKTEPTPEVPHIKPVIVKKEEPEVRIAPVEKRYLIDRDILTASGYIADQVESKGTLIGSPNDTYLLGKDDYAYVRTAQSVKKADKFYIKRSLGKVIHPDSGKMLGYLINIVGVAEVTGTENGETKVRINSSYTEVLVGDLLDDYYEIEPPLLPENPRMPNLTGFIVAARQLHLVNGLSDVVYIDKGKKDGIEVGDALQTISRGKHDVMNGYLQVISLRDTTATAVLRKTPREVSPRDKVSPLAAAQ